MPKQMSLRQVRDEPGVCRMPRDHYEWGNWSIMTNGHQVWISHQEVGKSPTAHIEVPKAVFDRLFDAYGKPRNLGPAVR